MCSFTTLWPSHHMPPWFFTRGAVTSNPKKVLMTVHQAMPRCHACSASFWASCSAFRPSMKLRMATMFSAYRQEEHTSGNELITALRLDETTSKVAELLSFPLISHGYAGNHDLHLGMFLLLVSFNPVLFMSWSDDGLIQIKICHPAPSQQRFVPPQEQQAETNVAGIP